MPLLLSLVLWPSSPAADIRASMPAVVQSGDDTAAAFLLVSRSTVPGRCAIQFSCNAGVVTPASMEVDLAAHGWRPIVVRCSLAHDADSGAVVAQVGSESASVLVVRGIDLTSQPWRKSFAPREGPPALEYASPEISDADWPEQRVPAIWEDKRYAWCRTHVTIPEAWRGRGLRLHLAAVDDNDVTYFNGVEVGRTSGWDTPRNYTLSNDLVRYGRDNVVTVMVDNPTYGGGLYKAPIMILVGDAPLPSPPRPAAASRARPAPGKIGRPLPLRPMHVRDGVLRYPDQSEVALWGVNIYPQSWYQFDNMKKLKLDMKAVMRTDFNHLQQMGVEVIRIHVFDREISDGEGHIVHNEHLDLLDFLIAECSRRGIYLYFTPIAWWGGPNENPAAFSAQTSKPGMMFVPKARAAAANYLRNFLTRKNRYTGRALKDEPALCVLEVMNEPTYFLYSDIAGSGYQPQGEKPEVLDRDHRTFSTQWMEWLQGHDLPDSPALFPMFRYDQMRRYIAEMVTAIRSTGARQPVAISYFGVNGDDIAQAIADSECDAVTFSAYPGGWEQVNDGRNLLYAAAPLDVDLRLAGKARLAYEFDTPATNTSCYLYPALAAHFRSGEVQIACQFQYDSISTAKWNTDWGAHWLNWHYTPTKAVSFMIGGATFRTTRRGVTFDVGDWKRSAPELRLGGMLTSFTLNNAMFVSPGTVMYARSPAALAAAGKVAMPQQPSRIIGTGASQYVACSGAGAYTLERLAKDRLRLTVNPDVRLVGNSLVGSFLAPVAELDHDTQLVRVLMPGWTRARCLRLPERRVVPATPAGGWLLRPGQYEVLR